MFQLQKKKVHMHKVRFQHGCAPEWGYSQAEAGEKICGEDSLNNESLSTEAVQKDVKC